MKRSTNYNRKRLGAYWAVSGILLWMSVSLALGQQKKEERQTFSLREEAEDHIQEKMVQTYLPVFSFIQEERRLPGEFGLLEAVLETQLPFYHYAMECYVSPLQTESRSTYEQIVMEEGQEEHEKSGQDLEVDNDMINAIKKENENAKFENDVKKSGQTGEFVEAQKVIAIDMEPLHEFDQLLTQFYAVDSTTSIGRDQLDVEKLLGKDMTLEKDASKPQILIYHTHSQESFADSVPGDSSTTIMGAGEKLAQILRERYGFNVIHHLGEYDVESRDYAYTNAEPGLEQVLLENPSIEVMIDLHRDEVPADRKLVVDLNGRPTAKFMFFNGLSRTNKTGDIEYLKNPYIDDNLAFSFQMQMACNEYYPGITRKIYLKGYRYNMHYRPKSLLIEMGAQTNTVEEIMNACDPLAHVLSLVLKGEA